MYHSRLPKSRKVTVLLHFQVYKLSDKVGLEPKVFKVKCFIFGYTDILFLPLKWVVFHVSTFILFPQILN